MNKDEDEKKLHKAEDLIDKILKDNSDIRGAIWCGAFWSRLIYIFINTGMDHQEFSDTINELIKNAQDRFDGQKVRKILTEDDQNTGQSLQENA